MLEEQQPAHVASPCGGAQRYFTAPCGTHWEVHEVSDPSTPTGRALIFATDGCWRRVRHYPAHWRELDELALWELSWTR